MFGPHAQKVGAQKAGTQNSALLKTTLLEVFSGQLSRTEAAQRLQLSEDALESRLERVLEAGLNALESPEPTPTFFSDSEFARMLRHSSVPWTLVTLGEGRFLEASRATLELLGYSTSELIGHTALELDLWVHLQERERLVESLRREGRVCLLEVCLRARDGSPRTVLLEAQCFRAGQPVIGPLEPLGLGPLETLETLETLYLFQDITAFRRVESDLMRSNAVLKAQLEAAPDGVMVIDEHWRLVSYNHRYMALWDIPETLLEEGDSRVLAQLLSERVCDPEAFMARVLYLYDHPLEESRDEVTFKDGTVMDRRSGPVVSSSGPDGDNQVLGRIWFFRDITEQKQRESDLERSKALMKAQLEAAPDGILVVNEKRGLVDYNHRYLELWNMPEAMMTPERNSERLPHMAAQVLEPVSYVARVQELFEHPLERARDEIVLMDGRTLDRRSGPVVSSEGKLFGRVWFFRDITEEKQRESVQREAREAADAANRAKSHFLANMSHELRTPLNAILGFAQVLARDSTLSKIQLEQVRIMGRSGEHLLGLINDVLEMSKIESGRVSLNGSRFDLHRVLFSLLEMLRPRAVDKNLTLEMVYPPELPQFVFGDESKLRQILINLLGNAVKFTTTGQVRLEVVSQGEKLRFEVSDSGFGIEAEALSTLFDPFVQSASGRQSLEGTGLGLPISRQFVRLMGGDIAVSSVPGEGSQFSFEVELGSADLSDSSDIGLRQVMGLAPDESGAAPHIRILAVDDKWENRQLLVQMLGGVGFEVREAEHGGSALEQWREWQPQLILMDMRMPMMDGFEATRRIRAESGGSAGSMVKIVALTASAFAEQRAEVLAVGCDDFVPKPFREHQLFECLALHLGIHYLYKEGEETVPALEQVMELQASNLAHLSLEWRNGLLEATLLGDDERCFELLGDIAPEYPALSRTLEVWVSEFRFRELGALLRILLGEDVLKPDL